MSTPWLDIGALTDIPIQGARVVKTPQGCIAVFRPTADTTFALDDACPHQAGPLSQGIVHGNAVTCPLHNWVISLESGAALGADVGQVRRFAVRITQGRILLDLSPIAARVAA